MESVECARTVYGIYLLPLDEKEKCMLLWFVSLELLTSIQSMQSNALMCGLLLIAFSRLEQRRVAAAAFFITCSAFIKGYGAAGYMLFLFYPEKEKFGISACSSILLFFLSPLVLVTPAELVGHYGDWWAMLSYDLDVSYGLSLMGLVRSWFGIDARAAVMLAGAILFIILLLRTHQNNDAQHRLRFLAMMLVWLIIFNHRAESPTYIIAMVGTGIWSFMGELSQPARWFLVFVFVVTSLSHTDLVPFVVKKEFIYPYHIKALPMILAWIWMTGSLLAERKTAIQNRSFAGNQPRYEQLANDQNQSP